ncbi:hypothetical protein [Phytohabitans aurantiacus]|uniref:Nucleotidyltransferase n=1 Tax=Phytohabitans aurantiacus TaxID=3016789 RepID=A0ABQ5QS60_9ACTN|nr:hypothetical protein [Phytohabitans aurantiacus]GLH97115.1 hypothetical protein Pa4123_23900 [Phytohabitans aurantiacus]
MVIGAQAIYLHTGKAPIALAEATKDCDLALDTRRLGPAPLIEEAMRTAGFHLNVEGRQPGSWLNADGIPVDLMVPESLAGAAGRRAARIPPHERNAARRAVGLEAAVVDHAPMAVPALDPEDRRCPVANVAGPAALLVAKLHKVGERQATPTRLIDKDAHDIYRLLVAVSTGRLAADLRHLRASELAGDASEQAIRFLDALFASGPDALGSTMAGRAEEGVGEPATVSASVAVLAKDLLIAVD